MPKVLVSGAGGYIGVPLCAKLVEGGHSVIALDRYFFGKERMNGLAGNSHLQIVAEDIRDFDRTS